MRVALNSCINKVNNNMKLLKWILKACLTFALMYVGLKAQPHPQDNDENTKKKSTITRLLK